MTGTETTLEQRVTDCLRAMTLEEKAAMLAGTDDWHIRGVPRLGVPTVRVTDCGHGVTLCGDRSSPATCFPTGIGMAATWNAPLLEAAGRVLGRETRSLGCSLLLGPMLNLHRVPLNGRCFETFSEDPVLAGKLGAALIRGIQAEGVGACVKAMAANNQQQHQERISAEVDERTLRELYLRAFEIAVREGEPCAIMTSYNRLNGRPTSESAWLIAGLIKGEWGFPGLVVSDWRAVKSPAAIVAGLDLEMPGPGKFLHAAGVREALQTGRLTPAGIDDRVARLLRFLLRFGRAEDSAVELAPMLDTPEHRACAQAVAEESIVLLKNDGPLLPLARERVRRIAVLGPNAATARLGGGGSASVTPFHAVSVLDGLLGASVEIEYAEGVGLVGSMGVLGALQHRAADGRRRSGARAEFFNDPRDTSVVALEQVVPRIDFSWGWAAPGPGVLRTDYLVRFTGEIVAEQGGEYALGVFGQEGDVRLWLDGRLVIDAWEDDAAAIFEAAYAVRYPTVRHVFAVDRPVAFRLEYRKRAARGAVRLDWERVDGEPPAQRALELARRADVAIVCAGLSNLFEGGARDRAALELPAAQNDFIAAVAAVNARTVVVLNNGGPVAMPWLAQVAAVLEAWYPGQAGGAAVARILFGDVNPSGKLPDSFPARLEDLPAMQNYPGDGECVAYREGWRIGYRFHDAAGVAPLFPFGFGLSYTTFEFVNLRLSADSIATGGAVQVSVDVTNTGTRAGRETVQLYVSDVAATVPRPPKELRAFAKIALAPGERRPVTLRLTWDDLAFFDPERRAWVVEPGEFQVLVGPDSQRLLAATLWVW